LKKQKILITGASGCVGQYITDWLLNNSDAELYLWLRDPRKLTAINAEDPRLKLLIGDIRDAEVFKEEIKQVTRVIHTATAWGDPNRAYEVNVVAVKNLLNLLNEEILEQIIYFSTASILNKNLKLIPEALKYGTEYIQTKAMCLKELTNHHLAEKTIAVFPTLVFGGRIDHSTQFPSSYLTQGLYEATKWLWLARWFRGYSRFHFIHAQDIAFICGHLAINPHNKNDLSNGNKLNHLVLAQPYITIDQAIDNLLEWRGMRKTLRIPLKRWLINALVRFLPVNINSWDRFSINQRHFDHDPISSPESFGGISNARTIREIFSISGLPKYKKL